MNRRLLATAIVGTALVMSAVLIVSLKGNDKPEITTNPPPADELPFITPVTPLKPSDNTESPSDDETPTEPEEPEDDADDGDDGPGDSDDSQDAGKARGLERALEAHQNTITKMEQRGQDVPPGLEHSMNKLLEKLTERLSSEQADDNDSQKNDHEDNGLHLGQGHDKDKK